MSSAGTMNRRCGYYGPGQRCGIRMSDNPSARLSLRSAPALESMEFRRAVAAGAARAADRANARRHPATDVRDITIRKL